MGEQRKSRAPKEVVGGSLPFSLNRVHVKLSSSTLEDTQAAQQLFLLNCFLEQLPTCESPSAFIFCLDIPLVIEYSHLDLNRKGIKSLEYKQVWVFSVLFSCY